MSLKSMWEQSRPLSSSFATCAREVLKGRSPEMEPLGQAAHALHTVADAAGCPPWPLVS